MARWGFVMFIRRVFAYPLLYLGMILSELGGCLIRIGAWCIDVDTSQM